MDPQTEAIEGDPVDLAGAMAATGKPVKVRRARLSRGLRKAMQRAMQASGNMNRAEARRALWRPAMTDNPKRGAMLLAQSAAHRLRSRIALDRGNVARALLAG